MDLVRLSSSLLCTLNCEAFVLFAFLSSFTIFFIPSIVNFSPYSPNPPLLIPFSHLSIPFLLHSSSLIIPFSPVVFFSNPISDPSSFGLVSFLLSFSILCFSGREVGSTSATAKQGLVDFEQGSMWNLVQRMETELGLE